MVKKRRQYTTDFKFQNAPEGLVSGREQGLSATMPHNVVRPIPICVFQNSGNGRRRAAGYCSDGSRVNHH